MQIDDDLYPLAALVCGTVVLACSVVLSPNLELAIAGVGGAGTLFGVSGTSYQAKVKADATKARAPRKTTPKKPTGTSDTL